MPDFIPITPGSGANVGVENVAGGAIQVVKIGTGGPGVDGERLQGGRAPGADAEFGLFVRELTEDNAYTQELLGGILNLLRSVWQMGSAAGAASLTVRNPTAADLQTTATISGTATVNLGQVGSGTTQTVTGGAAPGNSPNTQLVVAQSQQYHLPILPSHLYANIQV